MAYTTIDKPSDYFNTVTYVANQTDDRQITVGFQPDFTWLKDRDQAVNHDLYDAVRGATKSLSINNTNAEATQTDGLKSFNSTGFTLGTGWGNQTTGDDYVAWNWLASNSTASNTDGTITSTVSANQTAGFSIVSWTGNENASSTVGHGLGSDLGMIIIKNRIDAEHWEVWHKNLTSTSDYRLLLSGTIAENNNTAFFSEAPTSTVFTPGSNNAINGSGDSMIAYCFAEKKGYSKFGKYTGNGSTDGTFVYTGFKPAFVIIKRTSSAQNWGMYDNKREPFNTNDAVLFPNLSNAETSSVNYALDFVSNGFKQRATGNQSNGSGQTYIYMAFAENPFTTSTGIPCTAR
jgi:hypothetical protein